MKIQTKYRPFVFLLCTLGLHHTTSAQTGDRWIEVSSETEYFRVLMPHRPKEETLSTIKTNYGELEVSGKSYGASANGASYAIWVLTNAGDSTQHRNEPGRYLDACADLIWEGLLKSARDKLPDDRRAKAAMTYVKELSSKALPGREYTLTIGDMNATTQFYVAAPRIYVLLAGNVTGGEWKRETFFESFSLSPNLTGQLPSDKGQIGSGKIPASNDITNNESVFRSSEVTERAHVLEKPEPSYTESARKFGVQGTVVLRAIFSLNGEVTNISVVRRLPHGLTESTVGAARRIKFLPAVKDGHPVSTWIQLEYNFNLY
jgi:TonB family protein